MYQKKNIHFVGIGGIGMSAIAEVLHQKGFSITGSDISENQIIKRLKKKGIKIFLNHTAKNIIKVDLLVYSSAIKANNIELKMAKKNKLPILSRAMMLSEVMRLKPSITVSGSHGKTTTTSLLATILESSNLDPTIINGGIINSLKVNAKLGQGQWIVAEADESDGSFVFLPSTIGIINNIDLEHLDFYKDINELKSAFVKYATNIPFYGFLAICVDDKNIRDIQKMLFTKKIVTFGLSSKANFYAANIRTIKFKNIFHTRFDIVENLQKKRTIRDITIPLLGTHNVQNTLAAYSVAKGLEISDKEIKKALISYQGVKRRFSILFKSSQNMIIDDYAHHPKEIDSTLKSLRIITKKSIISIFEPHRYSRIHGMLNDFISSFVESDYIFILPIYGAGETNEKKIDNEFLANLMKKKLKKKIFVIKNHKIFFEKLKKIISPGDNIIFMGAGLSSKIAEEFSIFYQS